MQHGMGYNEEEAHSQLGRVIHKFTFKEGMQINRGFACHCALLTAQIPTPTL